MRHWLLLAMGVVGLSLVGCGEGGDLEGTSLASEVAALESGPQAVITQDHTQASGPAPLLVQLDATRSTCPGSWCAAFRWDFGDGTGSSSGWVSHTYPAGSYVVTLTVTDGAGRVGKATLNITSGNVGPTATLTGGPGSGVAPLSVYLDGTTSKPAPDGTWIAKCLLDWGDGASTSNCWGQHVYGAAGSYVATFTITDNLGRTGQATRAIAVTGAAVPTVYQPGYHAALRSSFNVPSLTTFRMRIPLTRAGNRIRVSLDVGESGAVLNRATVGLASSTTGSTTAAPLPLTFGGRTGQTLAARQRIVSDPVALDVARGTELYVSFEVSGSLSSSFINLLPGSLQRAGAYSQLASGFGGTAQPIPLGVTNIDVLGPQGQVFIALGDSITEGYTSGNDNYRNSWPYQAAVRSGKTVVPAAYSGSGILETLANLQSEVLSVGGITDCAVLIGTNNLHSFTPSALQAKLTELYQKLAPKCRVWVMPMTPRERTSVPNASIATLQARMLEVNAWIRSQAGTYSLLDVDSAVRDPNNINYWRDGYDEDGVHPSVLGNSKIAEYAAPRL